MKQVSFTYHWRQQMFWTKPDFEFPGQDFIGHLEALVSKFISEHHLIHNVKTGELSLPVKIGAAFMLPQRSKLYTRFLDLLSTRENPFRIESLEMFARSFDRESSLYKACVCPLEQLPLFLSSPENVDNGFTSDATLIAMWRLERDLF